MTLNIIVIVVAASIALLWSATNMKGRGAYSAFLNMVCVIAAGAIALGLWHFITLDILTGFADSGSFVENIMWAVGLLGPFIVSLGLLRLATDTLLGGNIKLDPVPDFIGGFLFGAVSAVITTGFIVMGLGMMRTGPTVFGHQPIADEGGQLVYNQGLWLPVDKFTVEFYEFLSAGALATSTPLNTAIPDLHEHAASVRFTPTTTGGTVGRVIVDPRSFDAFAAYTLEGELDQLLRDVNAPDRAQQVVTPDGDPFPQGATLWGIAIRFDAGAAEEGGQVVLTPPQVRLAITNPQTGETDAVFPIAFITRTDADLTEQPAQLGSVFPYHRFRIDANKLAFPTVGGEATHFFIPEFLVPPGFEPDTLFVKGVPHDVSDLDGTPVLDLLQQVGGGDERRIHQDSPPWLIRDLGVGSGLLLQAMDIPVLTGTDWLNLEAAQEATASPDDAGLRRDNRLPSRFALTRNTAGGLDVSDDRVITGGSTQIRLETITGAVNQNLRVDSFLQPPTTTMVILTLADNNGEFTATGREFIASSPDDIPVLVGAEGQQFQPVGFVHSDGNTVSIQLEPTEPIRGFRDLPSQLSQANPQPTWLLYRVNTGVEIIAITDSLRGERANVTPRLVLDPAFATRRRR